jgi:hypothetical protein
MNRKAAQSVWLTLIFLGSALLGSLNLMGQATFEGCRDINGVPVPSVPNAGLQDVAQATILNGRAIIYFNPAVLAWTRPQTRLFFYAHECGHHALGHVMSGLRLGQEQEADCWGISRLRELGLLSDRDVTLVQGDIARFGRGDWTHLPGRQRAINLRKCLSDNSDSDDGEDSSVRPDAKSAQPRGHYEVVQCSHPLHPNGDLGPCQHVCGYNAYGQPLQCHQAGDLYPCVHPAHPSGDRVWVSE